MRETKFIEQNEKKWKAFEEILENGSDNPDELNKLYIQITDDLSYARTFYPNRSVRVYLNGLAQRIFTKIYKNKQPLRGRFWRFWKDELPQLIYESKNAFRLSLFVFVLSLGVGVLSSMQDPEFAKVILSERYIEMTEENIEKGDPMAVYKDKEAFGMTFRITLNNLMVSLVIFVFGVFYSVGSIIPIIQNGVMVGAFQYMFIEKGLFWESFLTIWIHGTLEMSAMVIAGAAGMTMGRGLIFPGNFSRRQAFQKSARRGVKILIGIVPLVLLAGILEGYLTRHTETSMLLRGVFILACLAFVLVYYVWYPWMRGKQGYEKKIVEARIKPNTSQGINFKKIKTSATIMGEVFLFMRKNLGLIFLISIVGSLLFTGATFIWADKIPEDVFLFTQRALSISVLDEFFISSALPFMSLLMGFNMTLLAFVIFLKLQQETTVLTISIKQHFASFSKVLLGIMCIEMILWILPTWGFLILFFLLPIILIWIYTAFIEQISLGKSFTRTNKLIAGNYGKLIGLFTMLLFPGLLFFSLADTAIFSFFFRVLSWIIHFEQATMNNITAVIQTFLLLTFLNLLMVSIIIGSGIVYYTLLESNDALHLLEKIKTIGLKRRIKGLERE